MEEPPVNPGVLARLERIAQTRGIAESLFRSREEAAKWLSRRNRPAITS